MERTVIQIPVGKISVDDNIRFSLLPARVARLADIITSDGTVKNPIEVVDIGSGEYMLETGAYRLAASTKAGFATVPAFIVESKSDVDRLKSQLSENFDRQDMTLMDCAVAIKKMFAAGMDRAAIRTYFARPTGNKGTEMRPASNSWVNIINVLNDMSKKIQMSAHVGDLSFRAIYELSKHPKAERDVIYNAALEARAAEIEDENKLDAKLEKSEEKTKKIETAAAEAETKVKETSTELEKTQTALKEADAALKTAKTKAIRASESKFNAPENADVVKKAELVAAEKEANDAVTAATKLKESLTKKVKTLESKVETVKTTAEDRAAKLKQLREAAKSGEAPKKKATSVSDDDVKKAAKKVGSVPDSGPVKLNATEMRNVIRDLQLPGSTANVILIAKAFDECFAGSITDNQLLKRLALITGEAKPKAPKA